MRVLLIAPASGKWKEVGRKRFLNGKTFRFSLLSLLTVASASPKNIDIDIVDEQIDGIPWNKTYDLVGITCMTATIFRAYEISSRFRQMKVPVVLGGMHPSLNPEEALQHADAIVMGDAEISWEKLLHDVAAGHLKRIYQNQDQISLAGIGIPRRDLLKSDSYSTINAVQATRGCNHCCNFCSVSAFHNGIQRRRPVSEVITEVGMIPDSFFIFVDDNLMADKAYAMELLEQLKPLKKTWVSQSTLELAMDSHFIQLAADAGCVGIFVGMETFQARNLMSVNKTCHSVQDYKQAIENFHNQGIGVEAGIIFGFDGDRPDVFPASLELLDDLQVDAAQISIFTPLPGTPVFSSMGHRITDFDWSHYDFHNVVFNPAGMTAEELKSGHDWITREFYRPWRIARRLIRQIKRKRGLQRIRYHAAINLGYYGRIIDWKISGINPADRRWQPTLISHPVKPSIN